MLLIKNQNLFARISQILKVSKVVFYALLVLLDFAPSLDVLEVKQYKKSVEEQENCDNFLKMIWKIGYKHNYCALITFETFDIHDYS